jgi:hypothetical protein
MVIDQQGAHRTGAETRLPDLLKKLLDAAGWKEWHLTIKFV